MQYWLQEQKGIKREDFVNEEVNDFQGLNIFIDISELHQFVHVHGKTSGAYAQGILNDIDDMLTTKRLEANEHEEISYNENAMNVSTNSEAIFNGIEHLNIC